MQSIRLGAPSKYPRRHGNVYQMTSARAIADSARHDAQCALRGVRVLYWQIGILWAGVIALAVKVCL